MTTIDRLTTGSLLSVAADLLPSSFASERTAVIALENATEINTSEQIVPASGIATVDSRTVIKPDKLVPLKTKCSTCNLRELCAPCCGLTQSEMDAVEHLGFYRARVPRGEYLYRTGERFTSLFAVRYGFFKSTAPLEPGRDQVTRFTMAGEVLGADGIGTEQYTCETCALENSEVCTISFAKLQELAQELPSLQHHVRKMMSREIVREHGVILLLGSLCVEERLAMFLLNLSQRFAAAGYSPLEFNLRMTRQEIGSYLGMKLETVSRGFSKLQEDGLLSVQQRRIRIRDMVGLTSILGRGQG